ncbi:MAG: hypothetical protein EOO81_04960 [Oxalobacteraceae bacterium]|nr:MAG: hypothetical protein EOO81_04960 [Oxalobacteraceae bacterium]
MWSNVSLLNAFAFWGLWIAAISGGTAAIAGLAGGLAATRASDITGKIAAIKIAEANARADEARAETAKTNERIQKMQEARRLTKDQIEALDRLFRSKVFQNPEGKGVSGKKLRVSSVEDAEARMHAMEWQQLMKSCGVNMYPTTEGGFPSTCVQLSPDAAPLTLTVKSGDVHDGMQHLAHFERTVLALGFDMKLEYDPALQPDEGVLHVMRKRSE